MDIDAVVERIREREERRKEAVERIRGELPGTLFTDGDLVEDDFLHGVEAAELGGTTVAGVDGGLVRRELHGLDLVMTRAVAAVFEYRGGSLEGSDYLPSKTPSPDVETITGSLDRREVDRAATLLRLRAETDAAGAAMEDADTVLMDGSILPQHPDRPPRGGPLEEDYEAVVENYRDLYTTAMREGTLLAGVVEDTRSTAMCEVLRDNGFDSEPMGGGRDTTVLQHLLEKGERTLTMRYGDPEAHPILSDLDGFEDAFHSFYLKAAKNDRPVRVDVFAPDEPVATVEAVASQVFALSGVGDTYGIPPLLIEADQRAKIEGHEVEMLTNRLQAKLAHLPGVQDLRRDRRPF